MLVVMIGWVFFRAETLTGAVAFLKSMAGLTAAAPAAFTVSWYLTPELWLALAAGAIGSIPWVPLVGARLETRRTTWVPLTQTTALMALLLVSILQLASRTYNPFIYFRF
jgi:alginate O-acetyltransferase complex protein AlgI